eukprot:1193852-Heterocapsa_arctica.AAC.1
MNTYQLLWVVITYQLLWVSEVDRQEELGHLGRLRVVCADEGAEDVSRNNRYGPCPTSSPEGAST